MKKNKICICGKIVPHNRRKYCSFECMMKAAAKSKHDKKKHRPENCVICNIKLDIKSNAQKTCKNPICKKEYYKNKKEEKQQHIKEFDVKNYLKEKYNYSL